MTERKRTGARRSLAAAASTKGRRNDDTPSSNHSTRTRSHCPKLRNQ